MVILLRFVGDPNCICVFLCCFVGDILEGEWFDLLPDEPTVELLVLEWAYNPEGASKSFLLDFFELRPKPLILLKNDMPNDENSVKLQGE